MRKLVFVYGTLKSGYGNNRVLRGSKKVADAVTKDKFVLVNCGFPYMIVEDLTSISEYEQRQVMGEVYLVTSEDVLQGLDSLEGVSYGHYRHEEIELVGFEEKVTTYVPCEPENCLRLLQCSVVEENYQWP